MLNCQLSIRSYTRQRRGHAHEHHQLVLPLQGSIYLEMTGYEGKVGPGECVVIHRGEMHHFTANEAARFVVADLPGLPENLAGFEPPVFAINPPLRAFLGFIDSQLQNRINADIESAMAGLFWLLLSEQTDYRVMDHRIRNVQEFITEHISEHLDINRLASVACLSPTHFKKLFREHVGQTPLEFITGERLEKARALLTHTDLSVEQIAGEVGYNDLSAFSRRFSQHFGLSPSACRR